jgi:hypothetical protein
MQGSRQGAGGLWEIEGSGLGAVLATECEWLVLEGRTCASLAAKAALALALAKVEVLPSVLRDEKLQECGDEEYVEFNLSPRSAVGQKQAGAATELMIKLFARRAGGDVGQVQAKTG